MSVATESEVREDINFENTRYDLLVAQAMDAVPASSRLARAWVTQVSKQIAVGSPQRLAVVSPVVVSDSVIEQITIANNTEVAGTVARVLTTKKEDSELLIAELSTNAIRYANGQSLRQQGEFQLAQVQAATGKILDGEKISDAKLDDLAALLGNATLNAVIAPEKPVPFVVALGVTTTNQAIDIFIGDTNRDIGEGFGKNPPANAENGRGGLIIQKLSDSGGFEFGPNVRLIGQIAGVELAKVNRARVSAPRLPIPQPRARTPRS